MLALSGCGGGGERQDADEPTGEFKVEVVRAEFPERHKLAKRSEMEIAVRNVDTRTIPNVAVTVKSFDERGQGAGGSQGKSGPDLADPNRPVFVVNRIPKGGETAYVNTYALGPLEPGATRVFRWNVTAVVARPSFKIDWEVSAGLDGKAKAVLASGGRPSGQFRGRIIGEAPDARIGRDGETIVKTRARGGEGG